jgi:hypothetical protein
VIYRGLCQCHVFCTFLISLSLLSCYFVTTGIPPRCPLKPWWKRSGICPAAIFQSVLRHYIKYHNEWFLFWSALAVGSCESNCWSQNSKPQNHNHRINSTYHSRFIAESVSEISQVFLREIYALPKCLSYEKNAQVTGSKPIAVWSLSVSNVNLLVTFYEIHKERERCYSFVLSLTPHETSS